MEYKISDLCDIRRGASPRPIKNYIVDSYDNSLPWVKIADATKDLSRYIYDTKERVSLEGSKKSVEVLPGDLILSNSATPGLPKFMKIKACIHDGWLLLRNFKNVRKEFLYYILLLNRQKLLQLSNGSVFNNLKTDIVKNYIVDIPSIKKQDKILKIIGNIEDKLDVNNKLIANLEELSQTLFKRWFIDFEFPDRNGAPYKSSGGEMIDSELGEIPKNWSIKTVKETAESFNSIRKPLSKLEREKRESIYPYYGATKIIDYVDNYIFDGKYILVGEDGTVQTETDNPFIQYVWGKFWVSNHAHILKGKLISDELLMLYLTNTNVAPYITGAVQPKLNKKNLNSIKFVIADKETIIKFENSIKSYFQKIRILNKENKKLIELRDTLLPKLMSGEIEIPDDIEVNSDELSI
ncbi:restriction endonuclease subunit S [Staphylococcus epidermidis]|uniref:Type I restriction-modification system specificity subunit n=1 Tax=Staphylococcus epidermidis TaxID=1282 RepID=A0A482KFC8_STAEP|nr:type I restriction-modification system specificity subunit [Staphylococcus epidermidis]